MTLSEIWALIGSEIRQILMIPTVRNYFLATTIVVMVYSFFTNHLSVMRLLKNAGLFLLIIFGSEISRMNYNILVLGVHDLSRLYMPVIFVTYFYFCIWLGMVMGWLCNKILYLTFTDPYGRMALYFDHLAERARAKSKENASEDITSWRELHKVLQEQAASTKQETTS
jgi:hypothetical protein